MNMYKLLAALLIVLACIASMPPTATARKPAPTYIILQAPARVPRGSPYYPGRPQQVRTHTYAYGWFGAQPRQHYRRSTGYNASHLQWSRQ